MGQRTWATLLSLAVLVTILVLNVTPSNKKLLLASNFAIYDQLKHIAPVDSDVAMLIPFGQDNHTFRPSPKNITQIVDAAAFFYVSKGMDQWVAKIDALKTIQNKVDLSSQIIWREAHEGHDHHQEEEHDAYDEAEAVDPHYWFDITNQMNSAHSIKLKLQEIFPDKQEQIEIRYIDYIKSLEDLKGRYQEALKRCQKSELFVTHDAYSYLAAQGLFHIESVVGLAPESSPNPSKMEEIIQKLGKNGVKTIFFENFFSNKIAEAIALEVGIQVDFLDTLGTISANDAKAGRSYHDIMMQNLEKMAEALECQ